MNRLKFSLDIKPLSVNAAYRCRRFDTAAKKQYDRTLRLMLPKRKIESQYYRVGYQFFLRNFEATDVDNLVKCLQDALVERGIIRDDRYIVDVRARKFQADEDRIEITIEGI